MINDMKKINIEIMPSVFFGKLLINFLIINMTANIINTNNIDKAAELRLGVLLIILIPVF
jgi:hypothetical protein